MRLINDDLLSCDLALGSVALFTSFAVLEHVSDIDAIFRRSYDLMAPGGIAYHFADLADHRSYRGDGNFGPLSFLTGETAPPNMNRLRAHEIVAAALGAGFELIADQKIATELPAGLKAGLAPAFAAMDDAEIAVIKQHLVLRKPV